MESSRTGGGETNPSTGAGTRHFIAALVSVVPELFDIRDQFCGRQFSRDGGGGGWWFQDDSSALHLLWTLFILLLHQLYLRSSGIRSQRLRTPALDHSPQPAIPMKLTANQQLLERMEHPWLNAWGCEADLEDCSADPVLVRLPTVQITEVAAGQPLGSFRAGPGLQSGPHQTFPTMDTYFNFKYLPLQQHSWTLLGNF